MKTKLSNKKKLRKNHQNPFTPKLNHHKKLNLKNHLNNKKIIIKPHSHNLLQKSLQLQLKSVCRKRKRIFSLHRFSHSASVINTEMKKKSPLIII